MYIYACILFIILFILDSNLNLNNLRFCLHEEKKTTTSNNNIDRALTILTVK